ncbi:MAG: hypothetical protein HDR21_04750 [Lachnospiraceae bacterium]|nr:hypothetical protein [Lachnospiraceae bacterium]
MVQKKQMLTSFALDFLLTSLNVSVLANPRCRASCPAMPGVCSVMAQKKQMPASPWAQARKFSRFASAALCAHNFLAIMSGEIKCSLRSRLISC